MSAYICTRCALRQSTVEPILHTSAITSTTIRSFSTTPIPQYPRQNAGKIFKGRDANRMRGTSALRGTGLNPRTTLSVKLADLPIPVSESERTPLKVNESHGLWLFFNRKKQAIMTPTELSQHGRAWSLIELEKKSFTDLHTLWWSCVRERNKLYTDSLERKRLRAGYGDLESETRDQAVQKTMRNIREVLLKRFYAWEDARKLVEEDDEIRVVDGRIVYEPREMSAEEIFEAEEEEKKMAAAAVDKRSTGRQPKNAASTPAPAAEPPVAKAETPAASA